MNPHKESINLIRSTLNEIKKYPQFLQTKKRNLQTKKSSNPPTKKPEPIQSIPALTKAYVEEKTPIPDKPSATQAQVNQIDTSQNLQNAPENAASQIEQIEKPSDTLKPPLHLPSNKLKTAPKPIKLEKIEATTTTHSLSIKKHLLSLDPSLPLVDLVPSDIKAKERLKRGVCLYATAILVFENDREKLNFLKNLEKTITNKFQPAKLFNAHPIEKENGWESFLSSKSLKLIIATDHEIFHAKNLMKLYKELPNQSKRMVKDIDLFLLPDINLYFKQPILKRSLYKALCHKISTL